MNTKNEILDTIRTMTSAFAEGDINTVMSTYTADAVVIGESGQEVSGESGMRAMFAAYVEAGVNFTYGAHEVVISADTALHLMKWSAPQPNGLPLQALSIAVLRRQPNGAWKMVIDHPFGDSVMSVDQ